MASEGEFFTPRERLIFNRFAQDHLETEVHDLGDGDLDLTSVLGFSLANIRDHFTYAFNNELPDGRKFRVYPGYLSSMTPDAFAAELDGIHLCGMNLGLLEAFLHFSLFCFSQETLFTAFGDPKSELSPASVDGYPPGYWLYHAENQEEIHAFTERVAQIRPQDPERQLATVILAGHMMRFVWFHELYHCLNGHVGLAKKRKWALHFNECGTDETAKIDPRTMQCMEMDADQSAMFALCKIQMESMENIAGFKDLALEDRLVFTIVASYATNWMIDDYARLPKTEVSPEHPEPYIRLHNLITTLASNIAPDVSNLDQIHLRCLEEIARIAAVVPGFPDARQIIEDMQNPEMHKVLDGYQDDLIALRSELKQFQYVWSPSQEETA